MAFFACDTCGHEQVLADEYAGRRARCPKCKGSSLVREQFAVASDGAEVGGRGHPPGFDPSPDHDIQATSALPRRTEAAPDGTSDRRGGVELPAWATGVIAVSWTVLGTGTLLGVLLFLAALSAANGAPQEAAAGAIFATLFIAGYIMVRSIEQVITAVLRR